MEEFNLLVKEITPEEVKSLDPYEISYIAMKDGSIIMVLEKNTKIENNYKIKKNKNIVKKNELENLPSPSFNLNDKKKYISFISPKSEINQNNNEEEDYNVYYSNTYRKESYKGYELKNTKTGKEKNINNNNSFYSYDDIHPSYQMQNDIKPCNKINIEYNNYNDIIDEKEVKKDLDKLKINNTVAYDSKDYYNNLEKNKSPFYVIKKKYHFYKKANIDQGKKHYNKKDDIKQNNIYYIKNNSNLDENINNIDIKNSKYSVINNKNKYQSTSPEFGYKNYKSDYSYISQKIDNDENELNEEKKINRTFITRTNSNCNNINYYETYQTPKLNNIETNNNNNIDYSNKNYSRLNNVCEYLKLENENQKIRAKTPLYTTRDLKKNHTNHHKQNKKNIELKKCLSKENHKYYERKELSASKKEKSKYIKMKNFNGNTIHIFENK